MFFLAFVLLVKFATHPVTVAILRQCARLVLKTTAGLSNVPESVVVQTGAYAIACTIAVEERLMEAVGATVRRRARWFTSGPLHAGTPAHRGTARTDAARPIALCAVAAALGLLAGCGSIGDLPAGRFRGSLLPLSLRCTLCGLGCDPGDASAGGGCGLAPLAGG